MSKKDNSISSNGATLGEISTIRDILMGQQISEFEAKFNMLQANLSDVESKLVQKIKDLSSNSQSNHKEFAKETNARFNQLEKEMNNRFSQMGGETEGRIVQVEQALRDGLADLQQMMEDTSMNDKERIGRLLLEAGNSLLK